MAAPSGAAVRQHQRRDYARRATSRLHRIVRGALIVIGSMPWWLPALRGTLGERSAIVGVLGRILDGPFIVMCHRMTERSLAIAGYYMPLCSRCAGIFTGLALGALLAWPRFTLRQTRVGVLVTGLLMLAEVVTQDLGVHPMWHTTRLLSGIALGFVLGAGLLAAIERNAEPAA